MPTVVAPNSSKWYYLELWDGRDELPHITFDVIEDAYLGRYGDFKYGSAYVDHVPNPWAVMALCRQQGFTISADSLERIVGRWEIEVLHRYDGLEDL